MEGWRFSKIKGWDATNPGLANATEVSIKLTCVVTAPQVDKKGVKASTTSASSQPRIMAPMKAIKLSAESFVITVNVLPIPSCTAWMSLVKKKKRSQSMMTLVCPTYEFFRNTQSWQCCQLCIGCQMHMHWPKSNAKRFKHSNVLTLG